MQYILKHANTTTHPNPPSGGAGYWYGPLILCQREEEEEEDDDAIDGDGGCLTNQNYLRFPEFMYASP